MATERNTNKTIKKRTKKGNKTSLAFDIDYDKLAEAIVTANNKAKEIESNKKEKSKPISFIEGLKMFWKLIFINRNEVTEDTMTFAFLKLFATLIILVVEYFLYFIGIICVVSPVLVKYGNIHTSIINVVILMIYGCFMIVFGRFLRVSRFEIDNLENREYLNTIIGSFLAIIGTVIAIIEFVRGIR